MPEPASDPRVYFAAERTVLAWLRTGIAVMAFGFVVARFGWVTQLLQSPAGSAAEHRLSVYVGVALVVLGVLATAGGAFQYQRFCRTLSPSKRPTSVRPGFVVSLSWGVALIGALLSILLVV